MLGLDEPVSAGWDAAVVNNSPVRWIAMKKLWGHKKLWGQAMGSGLTIEAMGSGLTIDIMIGAVFGREDQ
jgi:hypothetical protein